MLYELNCLKNPQHTLGLAAGEPIHIVPISRTVAQAKRVVFGGICKKLNLANWFRGRYDETLEEVRFRKKGIYIVGGASQDASALGLNVICSVIDETNFMGEGKVATGSASSKAEDKATMIYNALARRVKSRYRRHGVRGLIMLVSSKRSTNDFTERRIKQAIKDNDPGIFVRDYAIWNVHPEPFSNQRWFSVSVSPTEGRCRIIEPDDHPAEDALVFEVPEDYEPEFRNDPDGCFTGDTEISLLDGRSVPIKDLVGVDEFWVYSYGEDGRLYPGRGHSARVTTPGARLVGVEIDSGEVLRCTPGHLFMLRDGSYREASNLESGDSLMPLYRRKDHYGYEMVKSNVGGRWVHTHKIIAREAHNNGLYLPDGWVVHHANCNKADNSPTNLAPMTEGEHRSIHMDLVRRLHTPDVRSRARRALNRKILEDPSYRASLLAHLAIARRVYSGSDKHRKTAAGIGRCYGFGDKTNVNIAVARRRNGTLNITNLNNSPSNPAYKQENRLAASKRLRAMPPDVRRRATMAGLHSRWRHTGPVETCPKCSGGIVESILAAAKRGDEISCLSKVLGLSKQAIYYHLKASGNPPYGALVGAGADNHKVVRVHDLMGYEDVYDITVDRWHNFALSAGIVVHNSTRDIAGIATDFAGQLFITRRQAIDDMVDGSRRNPFASSEWVTGQTLGIRWDTMLRQSGSGEPTPICCGDVPRHAHIDISTTHCATGLCIGHRAGYHQVWRTDPDTGEKRLEDAPVIHIDGVLRIVAPDGGDIDHSEVRGLIYRLIAEGLPIRSVSMDQCMGAPNLQLFKRRGLKAEEVGERKVHLDLYLTLRQAIYEGRVICHHHPRLVEELKALELDGRRNKVTHPARGTKDVADALAGVVYWIAENTRGGEPIAPAKTAAARPISSSIVQWSDGNVIWPDEQTRSPDDDTSGYTCILFD